MFSLGHCPNYLPHPLCLGFVNACWRRLWASRASWPSRGRITDRPLPLFGPNHSTSPQEDHQHCLKFTYLELESRGKEKPILACYWSLLAEISWLGQLGGWQIINCTLKVTNSKAQRTVLALSGVRKTLSLWPHCCPESFCNKGKYCPFQFISFQKQGGNCPENPETVRIIHKVSILAITDLKLNSFFAKI